MLGEQIRTFKEQARAYEEEFGELVAAAPAPEDTPSAPALNGYVF